MNAAIGCAVLAMSLWGAPALAETGWLGVNLSGERRFVETDSRLANVRSGTLAHLPALWDVFLGRLALVGVEPLSPEEAKA